MIPNYTKQPLVSIITPSFNQGKFLEQTITSVLDQDYPNIEYIVMDGGSTDNSVQILKKHANKLTFFSQKDRGQSDAINKGLKLARGEIVAWINSDDFYLPGTIKSAVEILTQNDKIFVYGKGHHVDENGIFLEEYPTEPFSLKRLAETCFICQPATFWRREVFDSVGYLDENLHFAMDYEYWIRIAKFYGELTYLPLPLACSRMYPENKTLSKRVEAHAEIMKVVYNHYKMVPSSWISAYCGHYLDKRLNHFPTGRIKILQGLLYAFTYFRISLKYNKSIPIKEIIQIILVNRIKRISKNHTIS